MPPRVDRRRNNTVTPQLHYKELHRLVKKLRAFEIRKVVRKLKEATEADDKAKQACEQRVLDVFQPVSLS